MSSYSRWWFNHSQFAEELDESAFTSEKFVSIASVRRSRISSEGMLSCMSENEIGKQVAPCVFHFNSKGD